MRAFVLLACSTIFLSLGTEAVSQTAAADTPKVHKIAVGGEGGWDYLSVDTDARRLYVSRGDRVVVLDLDKEAVVGELANTPGVHGVAIASEFGKGFTSNGRDGTVTIFDLKTLKPTGSVKANGVPDAILYDAATKRVFTFNHRTDDTTAIDAESGKVVGTMDCGGEPEAAVADGKGHIFVNVRSKSEIAEFDAKTLKVLNRYPLAPGTRPNGLGFDAKNRRLFSTCGNQKMIVMDADKGTVVAALDIGRGSDGCMFDPSKGLAYSSNGGDGTVTVVEASGPDKYRVVSTIKTQAGARTMTLDPKTHRLYLSAASPAPAPAGGQPKTKGRRGYAPGSFVVLVVGD
jgi:DNA-binding beta-propeller fold protein YncE